MKQVLMIQNGAADIPRASIQDRTPLQAMRGAHLRALAAEGQVGSLKLSREESDNTVHLLAVLCGIPKKLAETLPTAPLVAKALQFSPGAGGLLAMGQFLTPGEEGAFIPIAPGNTPEAQQLVSDLELACRNELSNSLSLTLVDDGQLLLAWPDAPDWQRDRPMSPLMTMGEQGLRPGEGSHPRGRLEQVMAQTLEHHPVNQVRLDLGENMVSGIWLWGEGQMDQLFALGHYPESACLMSSDPAARGLGEALGMSVMNCESIDAVEGRIDAAFDVTDCLAALEQNERLIVYLPSPFGAAPGGTAEEKVRRLDAMDYYFTGPLKSILEKHRPSRLTFVAGGARRNGLPHRGKVPVLKWGEGIEPDRVQALGEEEMSSGSLGSVRVQDLI